MEWKEARREREVREGKGGINTPERKATRRSRGQCRAHWRDFPQVGPAWAHKTGGEEYGEDKQRCPVANRLQPLIGVRHLGEVETSKEIPAVYGEEGVGRGRGGREREKWVEGREGSRFRGLSVYQLTMCLMSSSMEAMMTQNMYHSSEVVRARLRTTPDHVQER